MATIRVSSENEFTRALQSASGGDTILLGAGTYSDLDIKNDRQANVDFASTVTIRSEDPNNRAVINELFVQGASNIKISDVVLDYTGRQASDTESWLRGEPFAFKNTTNITLSGVEVKGNLVNGYGEDTGIYVNTSKGFTLENSQITEFNLALNAWSSEDVTIEGNSFRRMNHDGLFLGDIDGVTIEDNFIGDYRSDAPGALHKDNIQFYTGKDFGPSKDIVIRGNTIDSSDHRHGVFIFNELYRDGNTSDSVRHENILIEDNYIHTTNHHGITVTQADGVTVRNNKVIFNDEGGFDQPPLINVSGTSRNVEIIGNEVFSVQDSLGDTWSVYGNDVEGRSRFHWDNVYINGILQRPVQPTAQDRSLSDHYVVDRSDFNGSTPLIIRDLNFAEGDRLELIGFKGETFIRPSRDQTFEVWNNGGAAELNSFSDLDKVEDSIPVTGNVTAGGDALFAIDQGSAGTFYLLLENIAGMPENII